MGARPAWILVPAANAAFCGLQYYIARFLLVQRSEGAHAFSLMAVGASAGSLLALPLRHRKKVDDSFLFIVSCAALFNCVSCVFAFVHVYRHDARKWIQWASAAVFVASLALLCASLFMFSFHFTFHIRYKVLRTLFPTTPALIDKIEAYMTNDTTSSSAKKKKEVLDHIISALQRNMNVSASLFYKNAYADTKDSLVDDMNTLCADALRAMQPDARDALLKQAATLEQNRNTS